MSLTSGTSDYQCAPHVSVIIVNWNGKAFLEKLLESVTSQTYHSIEIIVVDNDSSDDSVTYLLNEWPSVNVVVSEYNRGFGGGSNLGVRNTRGQLLMFLNNDTWCEEDLIARLVSFKMKTGYDVVAPLEGSYEGHRRRPYVTTLDILGHPTYLQGNYDQDRNLYLAGMCLLVDRDLYISSGGFDDNFFMYFEEIDWCLRLRLMNRSLGYDTSTYVWHAGFGTSVREGRRATLSVDQFRWRNENALQMLLKNYSFASLCVVLPIYLVVNVVEMVVLFALGHTDIARTYLAGWAFAVQRRGSIVAKRKETQERRTCSDWVLFRRMYRGVGKVKHLRGSMWRLRPRYRYYPQ